MSFFYVLSIIAISNMLLGALVLSRGGRNKINRAFFLLVVFTNAWIISNYLAEFGGSNILLWNRLTFTSVIFLSSAFAYFAKVYNREVKVLSLFQKQIYFTVPLIVSILSLTSFIVVDIESNGASVDLTYGPGYVVFILYFLFYIVAGFYLLFRQFVTTTGVTHEQLKYLFAGMLASILFGISTNLIFPIATGSHDLSKFGPLGVTFLIVATTYAILRHRLLDVRLAIRAGIFRLIFVAVYGIIGIFLISIISNSIDFATFNIQTVVFITLLSIVLTYPFVDKTLRNATDSFLFQREYNRQELLRKLGRGITESIDIEDLKAKIRDTLVQTMRIEKIEFHLSTDQHDYVWNEVTANHELIVYDELRRKIDSMQDSPQKIRFERVREQMHNQEIAVVMPVVASEGVIGTILLGEKSGRDAFTSTDLSALETLMFQAGVAIENAQLYSETKQFNRKLQAEVKEATSDLQERNRRLTVLRQLDNIILNTLDVKDMAQKIVDLVSWEMGFGGALMVLRETENGKEYLRAIAMSSTPIFNKALKILPRKLTDYRIEYGLDPSNLIFKAMKERKPYGSKTFRDLYVPPLSLKVADILQTLTKSDHLVVYPLSVKGRSLGATVFSLPRPYENLTLNDRELIESFMDEAGIAIENAQLYDQLEDRNKELQGKNKELEALDRMKDELVSVASHELRTPMTSIKSYLWMGLHREENLSPRMKKYLERAFLSSERMINLVNDMLSASRLEGRRVELKLEAQEVLGHVKAVVDDLRVRAKEQGLKLTLKRTQELPLGLIDKERYVEILYNLIGNAIKYTSQGSITVNVEFNEYKSIDNLDTNNDCGYIWVSVVDTGQGIAPEDLSRLFKKFSKLEQGSFVKTAETGGTGLGLYITKGLVELHGGSVWVNSKVGQGSTFTFSVPAA